MITYKDGVTIKLPDNTTDDKVTVSFYTYYQAGEELVKGTEYTVENGILTLMNCDAKLSGKNVMLFVQDSACHGTAEVIVNDDGKLTLRDKDANMDGTVAKLNQKVKIELDNGGALSNMDFQNFPTWVEGTDYTFDGEYFTVINPSRVGERLIVEEKTTEKNGHLYIEAADE